MCYGRGPGSDFARVLQIGSIGERRRERGEYEDKDNFGAVCHGVNSIRFKQDEFPAAPFLSRERSIFNSQETMNSIALCYARPW
jgi:hypothetical protein